MGLLCEFDVCTDFGFTVSTQEFGIIPDYSEGCRVFCETFLEISRRIVPVDTGYLRSTLNANFNDTSCYAETHCEYAQYVEYGTWRQAAQPYFEPALQAALLQAEPFWVQAEEDAWEEEMMLLEEMWKEEQRQAAYRVRGGGRGESGRVGFGVWLGTLLGSLVAAFIVTFVQAAFDTSSGRGDLSRSGLERLREGHIGVIHLPDIEIT